MFQLDYSALLPYWQQLWDGALMTIQLAALSIVTGFVFGTLCAIARRSNVRWLSRLCAIYVESIRNTPFLIQIFVVYFGLASLGLSLSAFTVAAAALAINVGAYSAEIMRAGFGSIPQGQIEAGESLSLSKVQIYWHVMLLPAIERVYPALTSQFVLLMLGSSVASQISAEEVTAVTNYVQSATFRAFESYTVLAAIYLALSFLMRLTFWLLGLVIFPRRRRLRTPI
ncbi:amino acid ABC transporter permease [Celeribacter indicus]|uniref:Polar amino acid ABC transporter inner membrane subunit n=1 Tax=Celeribacter indicus TaxID=1208324 RepID=A0A0B5E057_9RHOB|nr:amino acid ABC transporter permease [Celeribacter indicus]AJE46770.1 polar amino acid ABC transporter inner membrane subunit [Celeribacter indicus]SDX06006.1 amino acid ABC transporter membrane protein 1, PAAT family [Celeribacter indicus]